MCKNHKLFALFIMVTGLLWKAQAYLWANTLSKNSPEMKESIYCCYNREVVQHKSGWGTICLKMLN